MQVFDGWTPERLASLRARVDQKGMRDQWRLRLCLDVTLFYEGGYPANRAALAEALAICDEATGPGPRFYALAGSNKFRRAPANVVREVLQTWSAPGSEPTGRYALRVEGGPTAHDVGDRSFRLYDDGRDPGFLRLTLPLERAGELADLAARLAALLPVVSGQAGLCANTCSDYPSSLPDYPVLALSRELPGVDFGDPLLWATFMRVGLKGVNWITVMGPDAVRELGGEARMRTVAGPGVVFRQAGRALTLQAGPRPVFGDAGDAAGLAAYRAAWSAVRRLRIKDAALGPYDEIGGAENTRAWLSRFD